jgi:hypothetical protein
MMQIAQRLRLVLSKGPNRVGVSLHSPEPGDRSSFQNGAFSGMWNFWSPETLYFCVCQILIHIIFISLITTEVFVCIVSCFWPLS